MEITAEYEPTVDEVVGTLRRNMRKPVRQWWVFVVLFMALGAVVAAGYDQWVARVLLILLGGFFLLMIRSQPTVIERITSRLCNPTTLRLTADRFTFELPSEQGSALWALTTVVTAPHCWTFTVAKKVSVILPKRALACVIHGDREVGLVGGV